MKKAYRKKNSENEHSSHMHFKEVEIKHEKDPILGYKLRNYSDCYFKIYKRTRLTKESY